MENRSKIEQNMPELRNITDHRQRLGMISKKAGALWGELSDSDKKPYVKKAYLDLDRVSELRAHKKAAWKRSSRNSKYRFVAKYRGALKRQHPDWSFDKLSETLGQMWRSHKRT